MPQSRHRLKLHPLAWRELGNIFAELQQLAAGSRRRIRYLDQPCESDEVRYAVVVLERFC